LTQDRLILDTSSPQENSPGTNFLGEAESGSEPLQYAMPELKGKVPELEQGARTGTGSQNWSRASELEQGVRIGAR